MTTHQQIRQHLLAQAGIFPATPKISKTLDEIEKEQWNSKFERLMRNRLTMAYFRYIPIKQQIGKGKYKNIESIKKRLAKYEETHNREHLVDIANMCLVEFTVNPDYPFEAIDDGEHTESK